MGRKRLEYWLALSMLRGVERNMAAVIESFGGPDGLFLSGGDGASGLSPAFTRAAREFDSWDKVEREIEEAGKAGARLVTYEDAQYPSALKMAYDPPCLLYMKGGAYMDSRTAVAIVGTRRPTHYGLRMAEELGQGLAAMGVTVVSGMARGCDMAAHKGALGSGGHTAAVLGTGVDVAYPREARKLYDEIVEKGVVISEYPISTPPHAHNFPRRNRIISALSAAVVVVEAPERSGSLMTARLALEYGREVMAVPGQVTSLRSSGTNRLIKDGATLVEGAADVAAALSIPAAPQPGPRMQRPALGPEEAVIMRAIDDGPLHIDDLARKAGLTAAKASTMLLEMELKGLVEKRPGMCFARRA